MAWTSTKKKLPGISGMKNPTSIHLTVNRPSSRVLVTIRVSAPELERTGRMSGDQKTDTYALGPPADGIEPGTGREHPSKPSKAT